MRSRETREYLTRNNDACFVGAVVNVVLRREVDDVGVGERRMSALNRVFVDWALFGGMLNRLPSKLKSTIMEKWRS